MNTTPRALLVLLLLLGAPAALAAPVVHHVPPAEVRVGDGLLLVAAVDGSLGDLALVARHRRPGEAGWHDALFERSSAGGYRAVLPAAAFTRPVHEYYLALVGEAGETLVYASPEAPHQVRVEPAPADRWVEVETARLGGRRARVAARFEYANFEGDFGADRFGRGEVGWSYRRIRALYSFSLGYGFVEGTTPRPACPRGWARDGTGACQPAADPNAFDVDLVETALRYGVADVRFRLAAPVLLDLGVILGFSYDSGFVAGVRGALTLGREDRGYVRVGAETIGDMGPSIWARLGWDTAYPFLMGVEVRATDLPDASLASGVILSYDVSYPFAPGFTGGLIVNYANREHRSGSLGGGLNVALEF